jgi:Transcriptional regulator
MTQKQSKEKRIDDILAAAVEVFVEKGYENTSMEEIAKHAGLSKGGLYHHFLSKDMVLLYANQKLMEPIDDLMKTANDFETAAEGLEYFIFNYLKYWSERKMELIFFSLSMTKAMSKTDIFKLYERFVENYIKFYESLYQKGINNKEFKVHNIRSSAITLMSALDGVVIYMALDKKLDLESVSSSFKERFVEAFI